MNRWVAGARPRTLPAAVVPVVVGAACAVGETTGGGNGAGPVWWRVGPALVVSLALQIATNYANDYSDGVRGTDDVRVGPLRLVASGLASAASVKRAAFVAFAVAGVSGAVLALAVGPELFLVGAAAMAAGWFYLGLGEVFVFVFFGVVATAGTTYVLLERMSGLSLLASAGVGALACALLVVNNLRDIPTDRTAGKRTLAVRIGDARTRALYTSLVGGSFVVAALCAVSRPPALLGLVATPLAAAPVRAVRRGAAGRDLIPVLGGTGRLQLAYGALLAAGLVAGG
jgi:1,4-dihydroxy-2-naphthoate octaprenyltransferase